MTRATSGGVLLAAGLGLTALLAMTSAQQPPPAAGRKVFKDSVLPLPEQPGLGPHGLVVNAAGLQHKKDKLDILFSLSIPKEARAKLEERVAKGEVVPPEELARDFSPKPEDVKVLVDWLKKEGFQVTRTTPDRTSVYARGTVAQIEKSLQVKMVRVTKDGLTYNAAQNAPSLPSEVGEGVRAIIGLQPFRHANRHARRRTPVAPTPSTANAPPYLVKEILKAYNADNLGVTGSGQKIAILIDTLPGKRDLKNFWTHNNLSVKPAQIETINVKGGRLPPREGEETLDVEWASGIAPGATIRVYASGSLEFVDLDRALDQIIEDLQTQPGLRQLSISLGLGEQFLSPGGTLDGELATENQKFLQLAAAGVNVFVSSGDAGSNPDSTGHGSGEVTQVEFQSSDPFVIGVGGTRLQLSGGGEVASETAWPGSGGGKSLVLDRPVWQKGPGVPEGNKRLVPDVSLVADPDTGAYIRFQDEDQQIGGTSWSAPVWAGFCALINESRSKANKPPLPYLNPLLYPLLGKGQSFRDITEGRNGAFTAGPGYDMVTGIGVPNVRELVNALTK